LVAKVQLILGDEAARTCVAEKGQALLRDEVTIDRMVDALEAAIRQAAEVWRKKNNQS
jgi:myo-inositol catabolism protein IolC